MTSLTSRAASEPPGSADLLVNEVVGVPAGIGATARRARADAYDAWLARLLGRRQCAPYGDLDLVLVHAGVPGIDELAAALWYPIWDAGLRLDHSVRTVAEALSVAQDDVKVALGLLDARLVAGDPDLADTLVSSATDHWRRTAVRQLAPLRESTAARWQAHGELAHLLEGDLKEAAGGLRDVGILRAIATAGITDALRPAVHAAHLRLLDTRDALHQQVGRRVDRLLAQERDGVAALLGRPVRTGAAVPARRRGVATATPCCVGSPVTPGPSATPWTTRSAPPTGCAPVAVVAQTEGHCAARWPGTRVAGRVLPAAAHALAGGGPRRPDHAARSRHRHDPGLGDLRPVRADRRMVAGVDPAAQPAPAQPGAPVHPGSAPGADGRRGQPAHPRRGSSRPAAARRAPARRRQGAPR